MNRFKLIASDLDGTLLDSNSRMSERNIAAISEVIERGIYFVPCTGRTLAELPSCIREMKDIRYIIHSNGSVLLDRETGERVTSCISSGVAARVFDILSDYEVHLTVRYNGECCIDEKTDVGKDGEYCNFCLPHFEVLEKFSTRIPDFDRWCYSIDNIEVISAFFHSEEEHTECGNRLRGISELLIAEVAPFNYEIFNKNAGKGNSLKSLADKLGIDTADIAAIGDSGNDLTMIRAVGTGVAVSNAMPSLKSECDLIICSNDEHAMEYFLRHCT